MRRIGTTPTPAAEGPRQATDWTLAACRDTGDLHHPAGYTGRASLAQIEAARAVCARCPLGGLSGPCLAEAMRVEAGLPLVRRHGIHAGTTPEQRLALDTTRNTAA